MKFYQLLMLSVGLIIGQGCHNPDNQPPPDLLSYEKLKSIQLDLEILQAEVRLQRPRLEEALPLFQQERNQIFQKHSTDSAAFYRSYHYYIEQKTELLAQMYEELMDSLENLQRQRGEDSIEKLEEE